MAFFLAPVGNSQLLDVNGNNLIGGKIFTYLAGTTTPAATYTSISGASQQANPIILTSLGLPISPIWLNGTIPMKFVIQDAAGATLQSVDNISGINDTTTSQTEWVSSGFAPTFLNATSFSVPGDQTGLMEPGRRLRTNNTTGLIYSTIVSSAFAATVTTVTVTSDTGGLDSGLSVISYALLSAISRSVPALPAQIAPVTTAGTLTAYTITPVPAISAYAANQSFFVNFHVASGASPTLQINGLATPPSLVKQNVDGSYSNIAAADISVNHRSRVTLLTATQALVERLPVAAGGPAFSAYANSTQTLVSATFTKVAVNTKLFDTNTNFDAVTNYRFTPTVAGYYQISGVVRGAVTAGAALIIALIYKNGVDYARGAEINASASLAGFGATVSEVVFFNGTTDYVELFGYVAGTAPVFATSSISNTSRFSAVFVRGV